MRGCECPEVIPGRGAEALDTLCAATCGVTARTERRRGGNDKCTHQKCIHTHTDTGCTSVGTWKQRWQCIYSIYYTVAYESLGVYIPNVCIYYIWRLKNAYAFMFSFFFLSLLSFCGAVAKLPDSTSWGAFLAKVLQASTCFACLTSFYIYSSAPGFLPLPVELSQTFVLAFDCTGLQLASPKSALCMVEEQTFVCMVVHVYV